MTYQTRIVRSEAPRVKHENARAALKSQAVGITSTICMYLGIRKKETENCRASLGTDKESNFIFLEQLPEKKKQKFSRTAEQEK